LTGLGGWFGGRGIRIGRATPLLADITGNGFFIPLHGHLRWSQVTSMLTCSTPPCLTYALPVSSTLPPPRRQAGLVWAKKATRRNLGVARWTDIVAGAVGADLLPWLVFGSGDFSTFHQQQHAFLPSGLLLAGRFGVTTEKKHELALLAVPGGFKHVKNRMTANCRVAAG